jgi:hypothetical protein
MYIQPFFPAIDIKRKAPPANNSQGIIEDREPGARAKEAVEPTGTAKPGACRNI